MERNIDTLVNQIYAEGVEKARSEAEEIRSQAQAEASRIIEEAQAQAGQLVAGAKKESEHLKASARAEIKLAAQRTLSELRRLLENILDQKLQPTSGQQGLFDAAFREKLLLELVRHWSWDGAAVELPADLDAEAKERIRASVNQILPDLALEFVPGVKSGFSVRRRAENYRLEFSDQALQSFLSAFLKEATRDILFSEQA